MDVGMSLGSGEPGEQLREEGSNVGLSMLPA
jgi:hypothetical protein